MEALEELEEFEELVACEELAELGLGSLMRFDACDEFVGLAELW